MCIFLVVIISIFKKQTSKQKKPLYNLCINCGENEGPKNAEGTLLERPNPIRIKKKLRSRPGSAPATLFHQKKRKTGWDSGALAPFLGSSGPPTAGWWGWGGGRAGRLPNKVRHGRPAGHARPSSGPKLSADAPPSCLPYSAVTAGMFPSLTNKTTILGRR